MSQCAKARVYKGGQEGAIQDWQTGLQEHPQTGGQAGKWFYKHPRLCYMTNTSL